MHLKTLFLSSSAMELQLDRIDRILHRNIEKFYLVKKKDHSNEVFIPLNFPYTLLSFILNFSVNHQYSSLWNIKQNNVLTKIQFISSSREKSSVPLIAWKWIWYYKLLCKGVGPILLRFSSILFKWTKMWLNAPWSNILTYFSRKVIKLEANYICGSLI